MKKKGEFRVRVIYADTDAMGIVYHANYIKWFEVGRAELMREIGVVYSELELSGYKLPVTKMGCHYLSPARYDDVLVIETEITSLKQASVRFDYVIRDEKKERILAEGFTLHPFLNDEGKVVRVPHYIVNKINEATKGDL
ncbi:MAG: acyl-CoA thioesterase [Syntrophobacterales bacterium]|nr:acyl-CoA thioesterase [Syntrophobacterales bacterium]